MSEGTPPEQVITVDASIVNLLIRMTMNDGSSDNIVDGASCIALKFPYIAAVNDMEVPINGPGDFDTVEAILDLNDEGNIPNDMELLFPVTVISTDFTETIVSSEEELQILREACTDGADDDIECIDIQYPVTVAKFNSSSELFDTLSFNNDKQFNSFLNRLDENDIVTMNFPVTVILSDGTEIVVLDLTALENSINTAKDDCDEDDDSDYNDDDCADCTNDQFLEVWAGCSGWEAHKFSINGLDISSQYTNLLFTFQSDGVILVSSITVLFTGNWTANGSGNMTTLEIDIPGLEIFNAIWTLQEIKEIDQEIDVRLYNGVNELHLQSTCSI